MKYFFVFLILVSNILSQNQFDKYFSNGSLRIDYYRTGNNQKDIFSLKEYIKEQFYSGSKINLIDNLNYGYTKIEVYDIVSDSLIFSKNYSTLFEEWLKTDEAEKVTKTFEESISIPFPKNKVRTDFFVRNESNEFEKKFTLEIDPKNYFIRPKRENIYTVDTIKYSAPINTAYDIVFLPEGYTKSDSLLFKEDCKRYSEYLFKYAPYSDLEESINIWGVNAFSEERGADIPGDSIWKNTSLNSTYYTFDSERYLMTYDFHKVKNIAANAPYDQIIILINSSKYGGGAIYNYYSTFITRNHSDEKVFIHEIGHGIAALADEYVDTSTYNNYYNTSFEPWEENITTLVDFESKWKSEVDSSTPIPTPSKKDYLKVIGAFEGAGYAAKNVYRPYQNCIMRTLAKQKYCSVCEKTVRKVIQYFIH